MKGKVMHRRDFLKALSAVAVCPGVARPRFALAGMPELDARLVFVCLRGGMDGLAAVPAFGDPDYERSRAGLAVAPPGASGGALALDGFFGLDSNLAHLYERWREGRLVVVHAHATPYRDRSHFDAQNVLEHGGAVPYGLDSGWLNRAVFELGRMHGHDTPGAIAMTATMPLACAGPATVGTWSASRLPAPAPGLIDRVTDLYRHDPRLSATFAQALADHDTAARALEGVEQGAGFAATMRAAAGFLAAPDGPRIAMVELGGWDSHASQARPNGPLARAFRQLDEGLEALRVGLGPAWSQTVVVVATEFGRTVAANGSGGTDHGTGGAAFVVGGAVRGGRVVADWPGLSRSALLDGRDLAPTLDTRAIFKGVLVEHLGLDRGALDLRVFPDSTNVPACAGLVV